jgi:hypothetical protein
MHLRAITTFRNASGSPTGYPVRNRRPLKPRLPDAESTSGERSLSRDDPLDMGVPPNRARLGCGVGHQPLWDGTEMARGVQCEGLLTSVFPSQEPFQHL